MNKITPGQFVIVQIRKLRLRKFKQMANGTDSWHIALCTGINFLFEDLRFYYPRII